MSPQPLQLYFLCEQNSCRSQMAEAWANYYGGDRVVARSAGLLPAAVHPLAIEAMQEVGIDISQAAAKPIDRPFFVSSSVVVNVCRLDKEQCPPVPFGIASKQWNVNDPCVLDRYDVEAFRRTRDEIRNLVLGLLQEFGVSPVPRPTSNLEGMAEQFKMLGDKTRLSIVALLRDRELCVCDIAAAVGISQPGVSQHLKKMKQCGLLTERRQGHWAYYSLNVADKPYLQPVIAALPDMRDAILGQPTLCCE